MAISQPKRRWLTIILIMALHLLYVQVAQPAEVATNGVADLRAKAEELKFAGYYSKAIPYMEKVLASIRGADTVGKVEEARCLEALGELQYLAGNYADAEPLLTKSLSLREELYGADHITTSESYHHLGVLLTLKRKYRQAENYLDRDIAIRKNNYGPDHPSVAASLVKLARLYIDGANQTKAEPLLKEALAIQEKAFGSDHPDMLPTLNTLAWSHIDDAKGYEKSEPYLMRALSIGKKTYGPEHPYVAESLDYLSRLHYARQEYEKSISVSQQALEIREKLLGINHLDVGLSLTYLARTYFKIKQFDKGKKFILRAEQIGKRIFLESDSSILPNYRMQNNMSGVEISRKPKSSDPQKNNYQKESQRTIAENNRMRGNRHFFNKEYDKAEYYFQLVLNYCKANLHKTPRLCCMAMHEMGALKGSIAHSDDSILYFESALSLAEKFFPYNSPIIADILVSIGHYYFSKANYNNALKNYEMALKIFEHKYQPNHKSILQVYFALGRLYLLENDINKAYSFTEKAIAGIEETLGTDSELYARCLFVVGALHYNKQEYDQAEQAYTQAIKILKKQSGPTSYSQAVAFTSLAWIYLEREDVDRAVRSLLQCHQLEDIAIDQIVGFTSEGQQLNRAAADISTIQKYLYLIGRYYNNDQLKIQEAFKTWINGRGRIFDVQARLHGSNAEGDNRESLVLSQELSEIRRELSKLVFSKNNNVYENGNEHRINELENKKDMLEIQLSRMNKSFSSNRITVDADSRTISKMLPTGAALLEFARTKAMCTNRDNRAVDSYIAFIVHPGTGNDIDMVDLGDATLIDDLIASYKKALSYSGKGSGKAAMATSRELYNQVFHPLVKYLGTSKGIFISPDGNLNLIPFETLQKPDGSFLIDEFTFNYLAAGRDLLGVASDQELEGSCLLMGAPDFTLASLNSPSGRKTSTTRSADLGELSFVPLPHAKAELEAISKVMGGGQVELYSGKDALEETLLDADHPAIIHLATHGFLLSDQQLSGSGRGFQKAALPTAGGLPHSQIKGQVDIENPLLRSGILLAGAQRSLTDGSNGRHDGIVTAEEILGMNLHGTKMVVLSACDTGLGEVKSGEGVFGLRRAFTQAGAKSLVMSMWKVPDRETKELMVQFYRNIKSGKMNRCQALRQAALKEMEIVRQRYGHANPRYWGAFVFMGEP